MQYHSKDYCIPAGGHPAVIFNRPNLLKWTEQIIHWRTLGHCLKVPIEMLDTIEEISGGDLSRCKTEVLHYWVKNDTTASWETLADVIENMGGYTSLVQDIREKCCREGIYTLLGNKNSLPVYTVSSPTVSTCAHVLQRMSDLHVKIKGCNRVTKKYSSPLNIGTSIIDYPNTSE